MHFTGLIVYNNRPMKGDFYLTLHRGLLAVALYYPRNPQSPVRAANGWSVPVAAVTGGGASPGRTTLTSVSAPAGSPRGGKVFSGVESSATPVCGYRLSLHG
ncbi:MAG: hypothetical protein C4534_02355 [Gaiellales bacterium]|nr:MAG: hypothetical protein C4534_02355 [Gaiellales bacterium]